MRKLFLLILLITVCRLAGQNNFYDPTRIQKISLFFKESNWDYMLDTAKAGSDGYILALKAVINNRTFDSVGVKYKGNSSYDSTSVKNPIHIELNTFKNQDLDGYKDIKLSNGYGDPSFVREALSYDILSHYMDAPQSNFAQVFINGTYWGVYTNSESINKDFGANHFYKKDGVFIKGNPGIKPSPATKSSLTYLGADSSAYKTFYELKSDYGWQSLRSLCDTLSNFPSRLPHVIDLDKSLWMLAFNNVLVNLDSYSGVFSQNFYLYKGSTGLFNPIVWDLNMSFGAFPFAGNSNSSMGSLSLNALATLPLGIHANDMYWPLIKAVNGNSSWKKRYIAHARTISEEFFSDSTYIKKFIGMSALIDTAVLSDPGKFFSYADFKSSLTKATGVGSYSVPGVQQLMQARNTYLNASTEFTAPAPVITPTAPASSMGSIWFSCTVQNATMVELNYRYSASGSFTATALYDDGQHNDGSASDGIYGGSIASGGLNLHYYFYAENNQAGRFSPARAAKEYYTFNRFPLPAKGQLVINELLADNKSDVRNEFHSTEDWIELYNTGSDTLSLEDCFLSDDPGHRSAFAFPGNTYIRPGERLTVWADEFQKGQQLHTNFKLNESGDHVILSNGTFLIYDELKFSAQASDVSLARCPDGYGEFVPTDKPSFGMVNCVTGLSDSQREPDLRAYPNPASEKITVQYVDNNDKTLVLLDLNGRLISSYTFTNDTTIDLSGISPGIYFLKTENRVQKIAVIR